MNICAYTESILIMAKMKQVKRFLTNEYIFTVIARFTSLGMSMVQSIVLARYLGSELQGSSSYILSIVGIAGIIMSFGMHQAYPFYKKNGVERNYLSLFMSAMIIYHLVFMIVFIIITIVFKPSLTVAATLILMPFFSYSRIVGYIFTIESPNKSNINSLLVQLIKLILILISILMLNRNIYLAIILVSIDQIIRSFLFSVKIGFRFVLSPKQFSIMRQLVKFGFFPMLAILMSTLNYKIDTIIMGTLSQYVTMSAIGIYSIGITLADKVEIISDSLQGVLASKLSKGADEHEVEKVCRLCFAACFVLLIFILLFGKFLINLLYGTEYSGAFEVTCITVFGLLPLGYFRLIGQYNIVNNKQVWNTIILGVAIVVNVILDFIMIPSFGIIGAAVATTIGNIIAGITFIIYFCRVGKSNVKKLMLVTKSDLKYFKDIVK